jgi:hypothetical protein
VSALRLGNQLTPVQDQPALAAKSRVVATYETVHEIDSEYEENGASVH